MCLSVLSLSLSMCVCVCVCVYLFGRVLHVSLCPQLVSLHAVTALLGLLSLSLQAVDLLQTQGEAVTTRLPGDRAMAARGTVCGGGGGPCGPAPACCTARPWTSACSRTPPSGAGAPGPWPPPPGRSRPGRGSRTGSPAAAAAAASGTRRRRCTAGGHQGEARQPREGTQTIDALGHDRTRRHF